MLLEKSRISCHCPDKETANQIHGFTIDYGSQIVAKFNNKNSYQNQQLDT